MVNDVRNDLNGQCFELFGGFGCERRVGGLIRGTWAVLKRFYCESKRCRVCRFRVF